MVLPPAPVFRRSIDTLYAGAALVFLATVALGIANVFMDSIPHGQVLAHFHSGTIGWVTLSVIATMLWAFGAADATPAMRTTVRATAAAAPVLVAGYVAAFGLSFEGNAPFWLLPLFGIPTALVILGALLFAILRLRTVGTVTTVHLLLVGGLTVASMGAIMGVLVGLGYAFPDTLSVDVGAHAGPMDMYIALAFAAIVEAFIRPAAGRWGWAGMTQAALGTASGLLISIGLLLGIMQIAPVALLLFLLTFLFYFVRVGWRAVARVAHPGIFWGGLSFPVYVGLFVFLVMTVFIPEKELPHALGVAFIHVTFVGMATNLVASIQMERLGGLDTLTKAGLWTTNIGLLAFIVGEFLADTPHGALLMAVGIAMVLWCIVPGMCRRAVAQDTDVAPA